MNCRFRVSKYKNISCKQPDNSKLLPNVLGGKFPSGSNLIASSGYLYAFLGSNGEIKISSHLKAETDSPLLSLSQVSDVTDLDFNPFNDDILTVSNGSGSVYIYRIPMVPTDSHSVITNGSTISLLDSTTIQTDPVNIVRFHPTVSTLLSCATKNSIHLFDCTRLESPLKQLSINEELKSFSFDFYGKQFAFGGLSQADKCGVLSIVDVRTSDIVDSIRQIEMLDNTDLRVQFIDSTSSYLVSSFINRHKYRTVSIYDTRMFTKEVHCCVDVVSVSNPLNIFIPHIDYDTGLMYFVLRNGNQVLHHEFTSNISSLNVSSTGSTDAVSIANTIKGSCLTTKRCLDVMNTEVNRLLLSTSANIYPLSYHIPRKSYSTFHSDLFPQTKSTKLSHTLEDLPVDQSAIQTMSLNPNDYSNYTKMFRFGIELSNQTSLTTSPEDNSTTSNENVEIQEEKCVQTKPNLPAKPILKSKSDAPKKEFSTLVKFKYLRGSILKRDTHITNVMNVAKNVLPTCETFKANILFGFYLLGVNCNQLAVLRLKREPNSGYRMSGAIIPHILCPDSISNFCLDPFNNYNVAIGLYNGSIRIFNLENLILEPENTDTPMIVEEYNSKLSGHTGKVVLLAYHPLAKDVLASCGSVDNAIFIWNLANDSVVQRITFDSPILYFDFSHYRFGGSYLAAVCKNQQIFLVDLVEHRNDDADSSFIQNGMLPYKSNYCKLTWVLNDQILLITGFNGLSERQFYLYDPLNLSKGPLIEHSLNVSPSILVPYFDEDTRTLFLSGRGDSIIYAFQLSSPDSGEELVTPLSHFDTPTPNQSVAFLPKIHCNVRLLEFAMGFRFTSNTIEPFSFVVPRLHLEYFHDDIFPPTFDVSKPTFASDDWFNSDLSTLSNVELALIDLKPNDMENFSEKKTELMQAKQKTKQIAENNNLSTTMSPLDKLDENVFMHNFTEVMRFGKEKQDALVEQISGRVEFNSDRITLDDVEGVDPDEWDAY